MNGFWRGIPRRDWLFVAVLSALCLALWYLPSPSPRPGSGALSVPARVIAVDDSALTRHGLVLYGSQHLEVELLSGPRTGERFFAANELRGQLELDKVFVPQDRITVAVDPDAVPGKTVLYGRD